MNEGPRSGPRIGIGVEDLKVKTCPFAEVRVRKTPEETILGTWNNVVGTRRGESPKGVKITGTSLKNPNEGNGRYRVEGKRLEKGPPGRTGTGEKEP